MESYKLNVEISVAEIVKDTWIGFAQIGGVIGKSNRCSDGVTAAAEAVKNLCLVTDIQLGIALAIQGRTTESILHELTSGDKPLNWDEKLEDL